MGFAELERRAVAEWEAKQASPKPRILVGMGTCGIAAGAEDVLSALEQGLSDRGVAADITRVGCIGLCFSEPLVEIRKPGRPSVLYGNLTPELAVALVDDCLAGDGARPDLAIGVRGDEAYAGIPPLLELPVLKPQVRIALRNCGNIDPEDICEYVATGGYKGLARALAMPPEDVIEEVKKSGLRGRGGAGFPTGRKWQFCRQAPGVKKYIICNADEGDPGAFMDRALLEGDPHAVLEGIIIGACAMGASNGFIYVRAEYPLAIQRLRVALAQAEEHGLLGENIMGSGFAFHLEIKEGAGAFVCGEETALMASIEGERGMPRSRPPFPAQSGLWGNPTNINNVETWGNVSAILLRGADWYASFGTDSSKGTKTFSLAGKINRTGLIEVPMGITLREIIFDIGGGILDGKQFKAVQTGGPSGGCLPARFLDTPIDYESLAAAGSIMGSGGMVVMDEATCMVDIARYFLTFTQAESCGKCVMCRLGTRQMLDILEDLVNGRGSVSDLELLAELCDAVKDSSLCALGSTAPNPVLTTLRYFRQEYEEHIKKHHCAAAQCKGLVEAACSHTCPLGIDVPRYVRLVAEGDFDAALAVIRERLPFPSICGTVCFHPCESRCRRGLVDEPVAIRALKRFVSEWGWEPPAKVQAPPSGKRVAVVGSGPAGLTAAYYLAKLGGHQVTIFEALPLAGGMLRVGIPRYRLPGDVLDAELKRLHRLGVEIKTDTSVSSVDALLEQGYDAVFLSMGAHRGTRIDVPGGDDPGVVECIHFLRRVNLSEVTRVGERVAVIGGGNAAVDAARTAVRLGARKVTIMYRRTQAEMPADPAEVAEALREGVNIQFLVAPSKIEREDGVMRLECVRMTLGQTDDSGRRRPVPLPGSEFTAEADMIIAAIGQEPDVPSSMQLKMGRGGTLVVDPDTLATAQPGVFAGGDVVAGAASVVEAIAAGRLAAESIDRYLGGSGVMTETFLPPDTGPTKAIEREEGQRGRPFMPMLEEARRKSGFAQVELGYSIEAAMEEARRCLRCDLEE